MWPLIFDLHFIFYQLLYIFLQWFREGMLRVCTVQYTREFWVKRKTSKFVLSVVMAFNGPSTTFYATVKRNHFFVTRLKLAIEVSGSPLQKYSNGSKTEDWKENPAQLPTQVRGPTMPAKLQRPLQLHKSVHQHNVFPVLRQSLGYSWFLTFSY